MPERWLARHLYCSRFNLHSIPHQHPTETFVDFHIARMLPLFPARPVSLDFIEEKTMVEFLLLMSPTYGRLRTAAQGCKVAA
jgi:hypothetical protein